MKEKEEHNPKSPHSVCLVCPKGRGKAGGEQEGWEGGTGDERKGGKNEGREKRREGRREERGKE